MAVTLTGTDGLFTRLGKLFKIVERVQTHQSNATSGLAAEIEDVLDEYNSADMKYADALSDSTENWQRSAANIYSSIQRLARETVIGMVDDDTTLNRKTLRAALDELIDQMGTSNDVKGNVFTVPASSSFTGTGDGVVITSDTNGEGKTFQNLHEDSTTVECVKDAQISGTAGREQFSMVGELKITDIRDVNFPGGNGQFNSITASDPAYSQQTTAGKNALANSDFEDFTTTDTPDNWTILAGVAGTDIFEEATITHRGSKNMEWLGDGLTLHHLSQTFNTSGQTSVKLRPENRYCCSFWTYRDSSTTGGSMRVAVEDGDGNILDSSNATTTVTYTSDTADTWTHHYFTFSTPLLMPDSTSIHIEGLVAIANGGRVYIDGLQLFRMQHLTNSSSFHIAVIPGATNFIVDDYAKLSITKATTGKFQTFMNQFLGLESMGLQLPYQTDTSESISDSLIS